MPMAAPIEAPLAGPSEDGVEKQVADECDGGGQHEPEQEAHLQSHHLHKRQSAQASSYPFGPNACAPRSGAGPPGRVWFWDVPPSNRRRAVPWRSGWGLRIGLRGEGEGVEGKLPSSPEPWPMSLAESLASRSRLKMQRNAHEIFD